MSMTKELTNPGCLLYGPGDARIESRPIPVLEHPKDVIIQIKYVGVCGSDVHFWTKGGVDLKVSPEAPLIMGHEAVGLVKDIGDGVKSLRLGDRVALEPGVPCRYCVRCLEGQYNLCPGMQFAACPPDTHGCLVQLYKLPEDFCYHLPDTLPFEQGVLVEPLAVAIHACRLVGVDSGSTVVVFGSGTVGLLSAAAAKAFGAKLVSSVDIDPRKTQFAEKKKFCDVSWISRAQDSPETTANSIKETILALDRDSPGIDTAIETSGAASSVHTALHLLRPGGQYVQVGLGKETMDSFPILAMSFKELHLHGCFRYGPGDFRMAIDLLKGEKVDLGGMVTSIRPFEQATDAWEATRKGEGIKNVIKGPVVGGEDLK